MVMLSMTIYNPVSASGFEVQEKNSNKIYRYSIMTEDVLKEVEKYIVVKNGKYKLDLKNDMKIFAPSLVKQVREQLNLVNLSLKEAGITDLNIEEGNTYEISDIEIRNNFNDAGIVLPIEDEITIMAHGVTKVDFHWWGVDVYLSATALKMIYGGVAGGSTVAAAALLTIPVIGWAIALGIAGGVATVATVTQKHGYIFHYNTILGYRGKTRQ